MQTYAGIKMGMMNGSAAGQVMLRVLNEGSAAESNPEVRAAWEREVRLLRRLSSVYTGSAVPHVVTMVEEVFRMQKAPVPSRVMVLTPKPETTLQGRIKVGHRGGSNESLDSSMPDPWFDDDAVALGRTSSGADRSRTRLLRPCGGATRSPGGC